MKIGQQTGQLIVAESLIMDENVRLEKALPVTSKRLIREYSQSTQAMIKIGIQKTSCS